MQQQLNRRRSAKKQKSKRAKFQKQRSKMFATRAKAPDKILPKTKDLVGKKEMDVNDVREALAIFFFNTIQQNEKSKQRRHVGCSTYTCSGPSLFNTPDIPLTTPTLSEIQDFVSLIFEKRRLAAETGVVALVLIMRTRIKMNATNWMRLIMLGMLLSNKEAEDVYNVWNVRYVGIIPNLPGYEINVLEMEFLQYLNYRLHVERPTYDKYYLQLHALVPERPEKEEVEEHILEDLPELPEYLEEQEPEQETETETEIETEVDPEPQEQEMEEPAMEEPETESGEPETEEPEPETVTGEPETVTGEPETEEPESEEPESETELEPNESEQDTEIEDSEQDQEPETDQELNEPETMETEPELEPDESETELEMEKIAQDLILQSEHVIHLVPRSCFSRTCPVRNLAFLPGRSDQIISRAESIP